MAGKRKMATLLILVLLFGSAPCMDNLVMDGCIVHSDLEFVTQHESINLDISYLRKDRRPSAVVKYNGGNDHTVWLDFLPFGKWSPGVLKLGNTSEFIPNTAADSNPSTQEMVVKRSKIHLKDVLVYIDCQTNSPNFLLDYYNEYQLPRTGKAKEEVLLLPPLTSNISLEVSSISLIICKVEGQAVVKEVAQVPTGCSSLGKDEQLKLNLEFSQDNKMTLAVNGENPITMNVTGDGDSLKFKQLDRNKRTLYIQCPDSCKSSDVSPGSGGESCCGSYTVVSAFLAIFVIITAGLAGGHIYLCLHKEQKCQPEQEGQVEMEEKSGLNVDPQRRNHREDDKDDTN